MDNQESVYVRVMVETLEKKKTTLKSILDITKKQDELLSEEPFPADEFDALLNEKNSLIERLNILDDGFEKVYMAVGKILTQKKEDYKEEILKSQGLISEITAFCASLEALEIRNRGRFELYVNQERKSIKSFKTNQQVASSYSRNMANQHHPGDTYFLDKSK